MNKRYLFWCIMVINGTIVLYESINLLHGGPHNCKCIFILIFMILLCSYITVMAFFAWLKTYY